MKKLMKLLIFILAFQMEVRVRASGDSVQQPYGCLNKENLCAVQVTGPAFHFQSKGLELHATESSSLLRQSADHWQLMSGTLWIENAKKIEVETPYARVLAGGGQSWVINRGNEITVRNIAGQVQVQLRDGKELIIPAGFEVWVAGVNSKGESEFGMIQPLDIPHHLALWNSLYTKSKEEFIKEVQSLKAKRPEVIELSSQVYEKNAQRQLASAAEANQRLREKQHQLELEKERRHQEFYKMSFER